MERITNSRVVNDNENVDIGSNIQRDNVFLKKSKFLHKITVLHEIHELELNVFKNYHNIDFSWLPAVKDNNPPFLDNTGSSIHPEVSLTL